MRLNIRHISLYGLISHLVKKKELLAIIINSLSEEP